MRKGAIDKAVLMLIYYLLHCGCTLPVNETGIVDDIFCDAEVISTKNSNICTCNEKPLLVNTTARSNDFALSGSFSWKATPSEPYAFIYVVKDVRIGERFVATVWRKSKFNAGVLSAKSEGAFYTDVCCNPIEKQGEWELLRLSLTIYEVNVDNEVLFQLWLPPNKDSAYFDDLRITRYAPVDYETEFPDTIKTLTIQIDDQGMKKLQGKRDDAVRKGVLISKGKDYVKGKLLWEGSEFPIKIRLKGDWTDHLIGPKWSFRIKLTDALTWRGMRTFSLQAPVTRHYLDEWVLHELLRQEGILTTRYGFVMVKLNDKVLGWYAVEEHFAEELLLANNRKKGVILKYDERDLWKLRYANNQKDWDFLPMYESSDIDAFGMKSVKRSKDLTKHFRQGSKLMDDFRFLKEPTQHMFNTDQLARLIALADVTNAYHIFVWHNLRAYYDPDSSKLELIAYDAYTPYGAFNSGNLVYFGYKFLGYKYFNSYLTNFYNVLNNKQFYRTYIRYLKEYSHADFIKHFMSRINTRLVAFEKIIQVESPEYAYDYQHLTNKASAIRDTMAKTDIPAYTEALPEGKPPSPVEIKLPDSLVYPVKNISVKAYKQIAGDRTNYTYTVLNFYHQAIRIIGYGNSKKISSSEPIKPELPAYRQLVEPHQFTITDTTSFSRVYYVVQGIDSTFSVKIRQQL